MKSLPPFLLPLFLAPPPLNSFSPSLPFPSSFVSFFLSLHLPAVCDEDLLFGGSGLASLGLDSLHDVHAFQDLSEDDVLAVQPGAGDSGEEELRPVRVGSGVGHGQKAGLRVLQLEVLILKLVAVNGLSSSAVVVREVASLEHEVRDHAMEGASLISESLLSRAEGAEVLGSLGAYGSVQLHDNSAGLLPADGHVEENLGVRHFLCL
mmetsp:Transcript_40247/g.79370  ORF Transcript_40247/g.79370 Transcript_40247/m.79370 type:complete len:207 (-) Transcript_40247:124-744(-)